MSEAPPTIIDALSSQLRVQLEGPRTKVDTGQEIAKMLAAAGGHLKEQELDRKSNFFRHTGYTGGNYVELQVAKKSELPPQTITVDAKPVDIEARFWVLDKSRGAGLCLTLTKDGWVLSTVSTDNAGENTWKFDSSLWLHPEASDSITETVIKAATPSK